MTFTPIAPVTPGTQTHTPACEAAFRTLVATREYRALRAVERAFDLPILWRIALLAHKRRLALLRASHCGHRRTPTYEDSMRDSAGDPE